MDAVLHAILGTAHLHVNITMETQIMAGPLSGVRIVDLSTVLMGPSATHYLGELGADVIKIESFTGDTTRAVGPGRSPAMGSNFLNMNRGKRSLALDLKHPAGRAVLDRLLSKADVFVHNIRAEPARRLRIRYDDLASINPRLIYCALTGFGSEGPYAGQPAYDDLIQGLAGLPALFERSSGFPRYVPTPIADRVGGLNAVIAITTALFYRQVTGKGQEVEVPMFESMVHTVMSDHLYGATFEPPLGEAGYNRVLSSSRHPYATADGWLCVLIYNDKHWDSFFRLIERDDLRADPRFKDMRSRNAHIDELYGLVADTLATKTTREWIEQLRSADIPAGPMNTLNMLIDDPHLNAVGFFSRIEHPTEGRINAIRTPIRWSESIPEAVRPAPRLGEHCDEVLQEYGYSAEEIDHLTASGATIRATQT